MTVIQKIASSLNRRDEEPNQALAEEIVKNKDREAIKELVDHLTGSSRDIQNDCIKVLYEAGKKEPELIAPYIPVFTSLLKNKNNRLQWGAMTALAAIVPGQPNAVAAVLPGIIEAANSGSVITKDNCVKILIGLCAFKKHLENAFALLIAQLENSPSNQLPMYAEQAMPIVTAGNKALFIKTLTARLKDIEKETKRTRVEKVIRKLGNK